MDRRKFLTGAGAMGAGLVALDGFTRMADAAPQATGWAVGEKIPDLSGPDQYGATGRLRGRGREWTLIDVSALWCMPCLYSATQHRDFTEHLHAAGVDFRIVTVIVETHPWMHSPPPEDLTATADDADRWSSFFGLHHETIVHTDGDPDSPLRRLASDISAANGKRDLIPCYLLVDPSNTVRFHAAGFCLNEVQALIAEETGVDLDRTWTGYATDWDYQGSYPAEGIGRADISFRTSDGVDIVETEMELGEIRDPIFFHAGGFMVNDEAGEPGFDIDTPISAVVRGSYELVESTAEGVLRRIDFRDQLVVRSEEGNGLPQVLDIPIRRDGADFDMSLPPLRGLIAGAENDHLYYALEFDLLDRRSFLVTALRGLAADISESPQLTETTRLETIAHVEGVRNAVSRRAFDRAARLMDKVARATRDEDFLVWANATFLAADLARLADRVAPIRPPHRDELEAAGARTRGRRAEHG